jgi:hypothetical protein
VSRHTLMDNAFSTPLQPALPLTPLREIIGWIEAIRLSEAPEECPTCGSRVKASVRELKRCWRCKGEKPRGSFSQDRTRPDGVREACRDCDRLLRVNRRILARRRQAVSVILKDRAS